MSRVEIVIDELVMRGTSPAQARDVAAALESRLAVLAERHEGRFRDRAESSRRVEQVTAAPGRLGDAVADAVWEAIA